MLYIVTLFCIIAIITYIFTTIIGSLIIQLIKIPNSSSLQKNYTLESFWGLTFTITIYSILYTKGSTIFVLSTFLLIILYLYNRKKAHTVFDFKLKEILQRSLKFGLFFIVTFALSIFWNYNSNFNNDIIYYSNIGHHLTEYSENGYHYFSDFIINNEGVFPYHYFEMWFQSIFENFTGSLSSVLILKYLVYNYFKTFIILGIETILHELNKKSIAISILIVLVSLVPFELYLNYFNIGWEYQLSIWERQNFLTYLYVLIPFSIYTMQKEYFTSIILIMYLPLISSVSAPSIFCFLPIYIIALNYLKFINKRDALYLFIITLALAFSIILFYKILGLNIESLQYSFEDLKSIYLKSWKGMILYIILLPLALLTLIVPLNTIFFTSEGKNSQLLLITFSAFTISTFGILTFQIAHFIGDLYQLPFIGYSFIYLISVIILTTCLISKNKTIKIFSYLIILIGLFASKKHITPPLSFNIVENNILLNQNKNSKIKLNLKSTQLLIKHKNDIKGRGFFILGSSVVDKLTISEKTFSYNQCANYLYYLNNNIKLIPLIYYKDLYKGEKHKNDLRYIKPHSFNDLLPQELFSNNLDNLDKKVKEYDINFLFIHGQQKINTCLKKYPNSKKIELNNDRIILILKQD